MKLVSDIAIDTLRTMIGSKVRSLTTNNLGTIVSVSNEIDREDYTLDIDWDSGKKSYKIWHFWCDKIVLNDS